MDEKLVNNAKGKKIISIDYVDNWETNVVIVILEDGTKLKFVSLTGISVN